MSSWEHGLIRGFARTVHHVDSFADPVLASWQDRAIREAAYALGATKWEVTAHHVLPYSTGGILTGMIIGLSRAIGETAPIITIGALAFIAFLPTPPVHAEFPFVSFTWLKDPFTVMPIQMFNWLSRPDQAFQVNAAAAGAILLAVSRAIGETMIVVMAAGLAANLTANPLSAVTTITVQIATLLVGDQEFDSAKTLSAFALGFVLFLVTLALNFIALRVVKRFREAYE